MSGITLSKDDKDTMAARQPMKYVRLGKSGLKVSRIILGCMCAYNREEEEFGVAHFRHLRCVGGRPVHYQAVASIESTGREEEEGEGECSSSNSGTHIASRGRRCASARRLPSPDTSLSILPHTSRTNSAAYGDPKWESWVLDEKTSIEHIRHAYERGINSFDTANMYSNGASEVVLGRAIKEIGMPRESIVVMTKVFFPLHRNQTTRNQAPALDSLDYVNQHGLSRKHIFASVDASLERLGLEYIDLLQCHRFDYDTPIEETMQALHDVVQSGKVRYVGMSSCHAYQFHQMQNYAITNRLTPFISMQNFYNAAYREEEREMIPTLKLFGTGMIPWSPLSRGFLTRPHTQSSERQESDKMFRNRNPILSENDARFAINERIEEIAKKKGKSMAQVALAWVCANDAVTAPIVGTTRLDALDELCDAVHVELTKEEKAYIDEPYTPRPITGHA